MIAPADEWRCVEVSETATAQCQAAYDLLVDLDRHRGWAGERQLPGFRLRDIKGSFGAAAGAVRSSWSCVRRASVPCSEGVHNHVPGGSG